MGYKIERYSGGKYMVYTNSPYPAPIGHITGANRKYLAECGPVNLGYFNSKKEAAKAISEEAAHNKGKKEEA